MTRTSASMRTGALTIAMLLALAGCGGVKLGDHTLVEPIARPTLQGGDAGGGRSAEESSGAVGVDPIWAAERTSPGAAVLAARAASGCFVAGGRPFDVMQPSDGPVDPWRAVDHGRPRILPHETSPAVADGGDDGHATTCTAAHDHCLRDCSWLVTTELPPYTSAPYLHEYDATADGFTDLAETDAYQAFRSLPVTRQNLDVGMIVLVAEEAPRSGSMWILGLVESIDWDAGVLRVRGLRRDFELAWARVAVLRATRGGAVEVLNGLEPDRLAIDRSELILPR